MGNLSLQAGKIHCQQDQAIMQLNLLRLLFYSGTIDSEAFKIGKQQLGKDVENWKFSQDFFEDLKAAHKKLCGRKAKRLPGLEKIFIEVDEGKITVTQACEILGMSRSTYYRRFRIWKAER